MVQRYEPKEYGNEAFMEEDDDGEYVTYDDYLALKEELEAMKTALSDKRT